MKTTRKDDNEPSSSYMMVCGKDPSCLYLAFALGNRFIETVGVKYEGLSGDGGDLEHYNDAFLCALKLAQVSLLRVAVAVVVWQALCRPRLHDPRPSEVGQETHFRIHCVKLSEGFSIMGILS